MQDLPQRIGVVVLARNNMFGSLLRYYVNLRYTQTNLWQAALPKITKKKKSEEIMQDS